MIPWADDEWFGIDKLHHAAWSFALVLTMGLMKWSIAGRITIFTIAATAVEAVEWWRWEKWMKVMGATWMQRPALCDLPSYRDLGWDAIGALLAALLLLLT